MMQKTDDDIFVACCDECFDEIDFRGRWNDFQGFIKSEGWHIRRSKNRGEMVEHICPACWEESANEILYQCSNCGKTEQTRAMLGVPNGMFYAGYRAHGDVLYCPDCVKTWKERNGAEYDEQYKDPHHLFAMWWNKQVQMQITDKSKIKTYRCNCIGDYLEDYR